MLKRGISGMLLKAFKLIDGETIFGDCEAVFTESGVKTFELKKQQMIYQII